MAALGGGWIYCLFVVVQCLCVEVFSCVCVCALCVCVPSISCQFCF